MKRTISETILQTLQTKFGAAFKQYYDGDPLIIPEQNLPCIVVEKETTDITQGPTGFDIMDFNVTIKIILNKKTDFGQSSTQAITRKKLETYAEGIDVTTGSFSGETVLGILRSDDTLQGMIVNQNASVDYGLVPRQQGAMTTAEAHIHFQARQYVTIKRLYPGGVQ